MISNASCGTDFDAVFCIVSGIVPMVQRKIGTPHGLLGPDQVKVVCKDNYVDSISEPQVNGRV